jgi:hypothetical protein
MSFGVGLAPYPVEENIMISDDTRQKIQTLLDKAAEITKKFPGLSQTEALLCASSTMTEKEIMKLRERSEKIDAFLEEDHRIRVERDTIFKRAAMQLVKGLWGDR